MHPAVSAPDAARAVLLFWAECVAGVHPATDAMARAPSPGALRLALGGEPAPWSLDAPLQSIFSQIEPFAGGPAPVTYVQRAPLSLAEQTLFPTTSAAIDPQQTAALQQGMRQALQTLSPDLPPDAAVEALLFALQRYAWCLPSPLAAVSLYDLARTHAALAAAASVHDGDPYLLGGDLSGVQAFLYTLTAAGATRGLRGRSFYLQLLTEVSARFLLRAAGLPLSSLLYAGGGRFYALLPGQVAGQPVEDWLRQRRQEFDLFLLRAHQGELYLALGGTSLERERELLGTAKSFRQAWRRATEQINAAKRRRFGDLGPHLAELFAPRGHGGTAEHTCVVCGYQGQANEFDDDRDDKPRCWLCESFEQLGRWLHNAEYLLLHHIMPGDLRLNAGRRSWQEVLAQLGTHVQLRGRQADESEAGNRPPAQPSAYVTVLALDEQAWQREPAAASRRPHVAGFRPVANTSPTMRDDDLDAWDMLRVQGRIEADEHRPRRGDIKPFSLLVAQSKGVKRLGVLRMDVDDLGDLFLFQLESGLARVSALSAALALFFEGRVGRLCDEANQQDREANQQDRHERVYTIYSGGDDLFVVGSWDALPRLAQRIRDDLAHFSGGHPAVHASAGISLHTAKFPLLQAAAAADAELKHAKQVVRRDPKQAKNAVGLIDQVIPWEVYPEVAALQAQLVAAIDEQQGAARALLQTCQQLYVQYLAGLERGRRRGRPEGQVVFGPWMWRGSYQLTRVQRQLLKQSGSDQAIALVKHIHDHLLAGLDQPAQQGLRFIEQLGLAARWAQLETRKERE